MNKILVLDNRSESLDRLVSNLERLKVILDVKQPMEEFSEDEYCGVIISGGVLPGDRYKEYLAWYGRLLKRVGKPMLGICLGLRIMGYCYGARMRKMEKEENGVVEIFFHKDYPLAPGRRSLRVYETHLYELISTGGSLINYASSPTCKIQAVKHVDKPQFGVQFHPEIDEGNNGKLILKNFVRLCRCHGEG